MSYFCGLLDYDGTKAAEAANPDLAESLHALRFLRPSSSSSVYLQSVSFLL